jgi:glycosyltransferase involved in cell wall biosynthesis
MPGNVKNHHFTVVIPTRERCDTLEHALHTCVIQDYDNLEILVSDNFSQDRTREVVESYEDSRICYINTGKRLSMTGNYEFALSHVRPEGYAIYIGDDDGLLPNALENINAIINQTEASVLRWDVATYNWPTLVGDGNANQLYVPLRSGIRKRDSAAAIQNVISCRKPYQVLPIMYMYSAIDFKVIEKIKSHSGYFYHSLTPDVYSGFALAGAVDSFIDSKRPYTIAGCSHNSIGASSLGISNSSKAWDEYSKEDNLPFHSDLVRCLNLTEYVIECFLQAQDRLPFFQFFTLDMENLFYKMMQEASSRPESIYMETKDAVLKMGEIHGISKAAHSAIAANPFRSTRSRRALTIGNLGRVGFHVALSCITEFFKGGFYIDCASIGVKNIYDASLLCHHILKLREMSLLSSTAVPRSILSSVKNTLLPKLHASQE